MSRIAGIALVAFGLACWPVNEADNGASRAPSAMFGYSTFATLYLAYLGIGGDWVGSLLWPAVVVHGVLAVLLAKAWSRARSGLNR